MSASDLTNSPIVAAYVARTPTSADLYERAREVFPAGVTHDGRYILPHPLTIVRAQGSRKWCADGREYVDYHGGHGALILGHAHPEVMERVTEQLGLGTHYGGNHQLETRWGELVHEMIPAAELVRFTSSGTEATLMALRLARAATGRSGIVRFRGHFHGWHDHVAFGVTNHFDGTPSAGVLPSISENIHLADPNDLDGLVALLDDNRDGIAAIILEPTGSTYGQVPIRPDFVKALRAETAKRGIVLIFDEVVTGFRASDGGAQKALGIVPDLTTLGKIVAGGLPGGAVAGRRDLMELLDPEAAERRGIEKIPHQGTFNANPVSAAAGVATLEILRSTDANERALDYAAKFRAGTNEILEEEGVDWAAYGTYTGCHIFTNPLGRDGISPRSFDANEFSYKDLKVPRGSQTVTKLRLAMRVHGVDLSPWPGGPASAVHDDRDLDVTLTALQKSVRLLREEKEIS